MTVDCFDRLEAELRAAVPRAAARRTRSWAWWRPRLPHLTLAFGAAVTVAVVLVAAELAARRPAPPPRPAQHHRGFAPGEFQYALGAVATFRQLVDNFAILRRAQTAADRSWHPKCGCGRAARLLPGYTRFARTLPDGSRVFVDLEQFILGGQLNMTAGSYVLNLDIVHPNGSVSGEAFGPNVGFTVYPSPSGGITASLIPDGVATVRWTFACPTAPQRGRDCQRSRTLTLPVVNNVAAARIPGQCQCRAGDIQVTWLAADGQVVGSFSQSANLPAPPFVAGGQGYRVLPALLPAGLAGARIGTPWSAATRTITALLGPPADSDVPGGGCGIDHESVWTSPAVADPLTLFERQGRLAGYEYGAPASEIGLSRGPGAVLTTSRGLTIADTIAAARRLYGTVSTRSGGTWQLANGLHGSVAEENRLANLAAGLTGCAPAGG